MPPPMTHPDKAKCLWSRSDVEIYEQGRREERADVVRFLRGTLKTDTADLIQRGVHDEHSIILPPKEKRK